MMQFKPTNLKLIILLFAVTILYQCQKDEPILDINEQQIEAVYEMNKVSIQDIPKIKNLIDNINQNSRGRTDGSNTPRFDFENILEVIDTLDNKNYSFHFSIPSSPIGTFYNLVIGQKENGELRDPFVIKYSPSNVEDFINSDFDFLNFNGKVAFHKYTDFFELGQFSRTDTNCPENLDEFGDPIPCEVNPVDGSSGGGGSDNPDGDGGSVSEGSPDTGTGGSSDCEYLGVYIIGCGWDNSGSWHPLDSCWGVENGFDRNSVTSGMWDCGSGMQQEQRSAGDECADCSTTDGGVGVVTPSTSVMTEELKRCLSADAQAYLGNGISSENLITAWGYLIDGNCPSPEVLALFEIFFTEIIEEVPDAKLERYIELENLIKEDPWILVQDCAEQNGLNISNYLDLYNLPFPQECSDRLFNLGVEYHHQPITDGNVPLANMDYYSVELTSNPDFNNDGTPDSEAEMYQAFRNNFIDLASGEVNDFQFSCNIPANSTNTGDINWEFIPFSSQDGLDFVSNDPIASILLIEAGASGVVPTIAADDGAVIVSEFTSNDWTISTISTANNGSQPFSGNRQWGWIINQNGNFEFFTRAVDVANISKLLNVLSGGNANTDCQQDTYYNIAEETWKNMQQEIADWVNSNGGQANVIPKTAVRVDREKIQDLLTSNDSIDQINSNCN